MTDGNVKVCGGILVVRSESGRSKIEKVLVETKPGKTKSRVKCRLQKFLQEKLKSDPERDNKKRILSLHSSLTDIRQKCRDSVMDISLSSNGDCEMKHRKTSMTENNLETEISSLTTLFSSEGCIHLLNKETPRDAFINKEHKPSSSISNLKHTLSNINLNLQNNKEESLNNTELPQKEEEENEETIKQEDSAISLIYENANKDSTIHVTYSDNGDFEMDDDEDQLTSLTRFEESEMEIGETSKIVMAQYSSKFHVLNEEGEHSEPEEEEDFEIIEESEDSSSEAQNRYLDSGLRRLKSDESRLYLMPVVHKSKRKVPNQKDEDGVKPLLKELPSDIFGKPRRPKQKESSVEMVVRTPTEEDLPSVGSSEDDSQSETSIDTRPLDKLKELEDKKYTISTGGLADDVRSGTSGFIRGPKLLTKDDFCIHTKDTPGEDLYEISSSNLKKKDFCVHTEDTPVDLEISTSDIKPQKKRKSSIFRFFKNKDDFCVHTSDPEKTANYSTSSLDHNKKRQESGQKLAERAGRSSTRTLRSRPHPSSRSSSQSSKNISTISLIDNKEARRSKYRKSKH